MKKAFLFLIAILSLTLVAAYPITLQLNGNIPFNTAVYHCSDSTCISLGSLYSSASGNPISYTINNEGSGTQYFAEYDYVSDRCYPSHSYKNWFDGNTGNGPWSYDVNFAKQNDCKANINSVSFDTSIYDNETQEIIINVKSPLNLNPTGPQTVPNSLEYYYSTAVSVLLEIRDQSSIVHTQTLSQDILWGTSRDFVFTLPLLQQGDYSVTIKTNVNDCMCNNYIEQTTQPGTFNVLPSSPEQNQTNQTNQLPIADFVYSPIKPNVSQTVYFDASPSYDPDGTISLYFWDFGDSTTATGITTTHSYLSESNYSVTLTVTDNAGNSSSLTKIVEVINASQQQNQTNQAPVANFTYSPLNPTAGQTITFDGTSSYDPDGSIVSYLWDFADGTNATGAVVQHSYTNAGNYCIALTVTDDDNVQSTLVICLAISSSQGNQTNQTNQTQGNQSSAEESCDKNNGKKYGDVDNIALRNFIFDNNYCGNVSDLSFEVYNQQSERMKDVKVTAEIPELNIEEESQFFNLGKFESTWLILNLKIPNVQGSYYARIRVTSQDNENIIIKQLSIYCLSAQPTIIQTTRQTSSRSQQPAGITGNAIAVAKGNASLETIGLIFLILILTALIIKVLMMLSKR